MKLKLTGLMALFMVLVMQFSFAQEKTITGTVTSIGDGLPLPGVNVIVKGTSRGVQTDFDGNYAIKASNGETLVFSFIGLKDNEIKIGSSNIINVQMQEDIASLDEVVVVAYGDTSSLRTSPASIGTVKAEVLEDRANASAIQNLQGQIAGLNISTGTGQPGADSTIILRGPGSINGNIEPLFVVDGIPVDEDNFRSINPNDIETYSVLKDAAAANIYGNRAANGAIVITTKRGKYNQALKFRYSTSYGYNELQDQPFELMNSREILNWQRSNGAGLGFGMTDSEIAAISNQVNTNWADVFFRRGTTLSHDLSISSGGETSNNFTSLQYFEQDGIFIGSKFKRFSVRNNFSGRSSDDKFSYNLNLSLGFSKTDEVGDSAGSGSTFFNPFSAALQGLPYLSPYDPDGSITTDGGISPGDINAILGRGASNFPYVLLNSLSLNTDREEEIKILTSFNANWNFAKNLTAGIQVGMDLSTESRLEILHPNSILGPFQDRVGNNPATIFGGIQEETYTRDFRFNTISSLNYSNTFADKHQLDVTAYFEYLKGHLDGFDYDQFGLDPRLIGDGSAFVPGTTTEVLGGATVNPYIDTLNSFTTTVGNISVFGALDYEYDGKYGFSAGVRRDNSFRFIDDNAWGTFWSIAGRWNIDQEAFMSDSAFDLLKLRASHGLSGNDRIRGGYYGATNETRNLYTAGTGYNGTVSTVPGQVANTSLRWEETTQSNIGVDFSVFNRKLSGSIDVYEKTTDDLFQNNNISLLNATGGTIESNLGTMVNKGIELQLRYNIYDDSDWKISVNANGSYNKNEIEALPPSSNGLVNLGGSTALGEGESLGSFYLVEYAGVNPSNGNPLFVKADGTLTETLLDADRVFSDRSIYPVWQGGFGSDIKYKGFEFTTQWSFVADVYRNNLDFASLQDVSVGSVENGRNRSVTLFNAWQNVGDITEVPRVGSSLGGVDYINQTDRYLEDASFLRLRNVTLAYSLPDSVLEQLPISGMRLYIQGENLLTFSKYRGWDPESNFRTTDRGQFPTPKIYTFGATINF
ncbi:SusC/RagA family TonB-linked outer membrane protein [Ichthyenterobacterium magnum]|uniref:TonB-linked SusC/RagA family outer membrane protein n=1 Tax=Ichthyenterobacterium magnum TaxID=1230530 RepID=A0A420DFR9_9FLAO|nr:SusC/RagA family TonB-linked outer membrane protein [Ichthyenterobacterium magnum]RKE92022.1 TonB-linked SusC/RagA family outer membrane protein [Ichthyenterobacterium magnum]